MKNINLNLFGIKFSDTKDGFLKKLDYYNEEEAKTDNFLFDYADSSYTAQIEDDEWFIYGGGVDSAAQLIREYDANGNYVLEQKWFVGNDSAGAFETCFLNCECPDHLKKYYKDELFITGSDNKLVEASSDYFREISEAFHDGEIEVDSDAEAIKLSNWEENTYWSK
tara:strand:+ start:96 stop:596 length:501 start_codon:yes stop_codon:yes gene_type:complete